MRRSRRLVLITRDRSSVLLNCFCHCVGDYWLLTAENSSRAIATVHSPQYICSTVLDVRDTTEFLYYGLRYRLNQFLIFADIRILCWFYQSTQKSTAQSPHTVIAHLTTNSQPCCCCCVTRGTTRANVSVGLESIHQIEALARMQQLCNNGFIDYQTWGWFYRNAFFRVHRILPSLEWLPFNRLSNIFVPQVHSSKSECTLLH